MIKYDKVIKMKKDVKYKIFIPLLLFFFLRQDISILRFFEQKKKNVKLEFMLHGECFMQSLLKNIEIETMFYRLLGLLDEYCERLYSKQAFSSLA